MHGDAACFAFTELFFEEVSVPKLICIIKKTEQTKIMAQKELQLSKLERRSTLRRRSEPRRKGVDSRSSLILELSWKRLNYDNTQLTDICRNPELVYLYLYTYIL